MDLIDRQEDDLVKDSGGLVKDLVNDCISRQAAIDEILEWKTRMTAQGLADRIAMLPSAQPQIIHCTDCEDWLERQSTLGFTISGLPAAQPQIIHCAECIHWKHSDVRKNYCEVFDWMSKAEDFCSFAERRSDGN